MEQLLGLVGEAPQDLPQEPTKQLRNSPTFYHNSLHLARNTTHLQDHYLGCNSNSHKFPHWRCPSTTAYMHNLQLFGGLVAVQAPSFAVES